MVNSEENGSLIVHVVWVSGGVRVIWVQVTGVLLHMPWYITLTDNISDLTWLETGILDLLKYPVTRSKSNPDAIDDIQDGLLCRKHFGNDGFFKGASDEKKKSEIYISFQINSDGVALFRSSRYSIWPVYLVVNELPPNCR